MTSRGDFVDCPVLLVPFNAVPGIFLLLFGAATAAAASTAAGAAGGGTADALSAVFLLLDHIADGQAQDQSNNSNNNQIFHRITFFLSVPSLSPVPCPSWR